jgi:phage I-like protein
MNGIIELIETGKTYHRKYGWINITDDNLHQALANHNDSPIPLPVKFGSHEEVRAGGWIKDLAISGNPRGGRSIYATVDWNDAATEAIKNKELKYISPEFFREFNNKYTGIEQGFTVTGAALLNDPQLDQMMPVFALSQNNSTIVQGEVIDMDLKKIIKELKLSDDATLDDVLLALQGLSESAGKISDLETELSQAKEKAIMLSQKADEHEAVSIRLSQLETEKVELSQKLDQYKNEKVELSQKLEAAKTEARKLTASQWVDGLISGPKRKILPAEREVYLSLYMESPDQAEKIVSVRPVLEPLGTVTGQDGQADDVPNKQLSAYHDAVKAGKTTQEAMKIALSIKE